VLYFATASGPKVCDAMRAGLLGQIATPAAGNAILPGVSWCADNAVFADRYPGDSEYLAWLATRPHRVNCRFAVAPDVVGDAEATYVRSLPMLRRIQGLVPVAYVGQNGATPDSLPWDQFDALFVGGDTAWKLGAEARALVSEARSRGKWAHMGRVNSAKRLRYAQFIGCDSADGTYLAHGPDANLPKLLQWLRAATAPTLWGSA
jgi:hypothetical protein